MVYRATTKGRDRTTGGGRMLMTIYDLMDIYGLEWVDYVEYLEDE